MNSPTSPASTSASEPAMWPRFARKTDPSVAPSNVGLAVARALAPADCAAASGLLGALGPQAQARSHHLELMPTRFQLITIPSPDQLLTPTSVTESAPKLITVSPPTALACSIIQAALHIREHQFVG